MTDRDHTQEQKTFHVFTAQMSWLKLAVAVAVIRNKPQHTAARDHAQKLHTDFMFLQNTLQLKYEQARQTIAQLQKKVGASENKETLMSDLQGIELPTPPSSSTSIPENQTHETELSPSAGITTNVQSGLFSETRSYILGSQMDDQADVSLLENSVFMQSMMSLRCLATQESHSMGVIQKNEDTVQSAIAHISAMKHVVLRGVATIPASSLQDGMEAINFLLETSPWLPDHPQIMQEVCLLVEEIITRLTSNQTQDGREKQSLVNMLLVFLRGSSQCLIASILESLVECFESFCAALHTSLSDAIPADSELFENSFFVIKCLELTMKQWQDVCPVGPQPLLDVQRKLERCLRHVANPFPLVAQAVWRVTALTEAILQA